MIGILYQYTYILITFFFVVYRILIMAVFVYGTYHGIKSLIKRSIESEYTDQRTFEEVTSWILNDTTSIPSF